MNIFLEGIIPMKPVGSSLLDSGKTPAEWVVILAERNIDISERTLREKANKLGHRIKLGRHMLITAEHMDMILKDGEKCRSNRTSDPENGGPRAESSSKAKPSLDTTSAARELYQSKLRGSGAPTKKPGKGGSTSSAQKPKRKTASR